ncbi:MAG TPA: MMPL family transporter [Spirochaetales bacterium]|nr:MMPL family transporter [Spirochaetales bacterium]HPM72559.1 MMPL family transporter [Spirochaetales bacterium]
MQKLFKSTLRHPFIVMSLALGITALAVLSVVSGFRMETNLDTYMPRTHPAFVFSDEADERFMIKDSILIAVEHPYSVFNPATLQKLIDIEDDLLALEGLSGARVNSIHTGDNILATEDGLDVRRFYTDAPIDQEGADRIASAVRGNSMIAGRLVSHDERTALIIVELPESGFSRDLYDQIQQIADERTGPETLHIAGRPIVEGTLAALGPADMARMGPLVLLVIAIVLLLVLRQVRRTIITMSVVVFSTIWAFGLMSALGVPMYSVSIMIPVMLIAIGVAYAIHLYNQIDHFARETPGAGRRDIAENAITVISSPALFAALTTVAGFVSLVTSRVYPVKYFGLFTAFGVFASFVLTMLLVPAGIMAFGNGDVKKAAGAHAGRIPEHGLGARFADALKARPGRVYVIVAVLVAASVFGISRVWINTSFLANFDSNSAIVKTDAFVNEHFGGTSSLNVILEAADPDTFKNPEVLRLMDAMQAGALELENVGDTISLTTYLRRLHYSMNAADPAFDVIPDSSDLVAQYLLLYEMSGDPDNLWKVVDADFRSANVTIQMKSDDTRTIGRVIEYVDAQAADFDRFGITIRYAGSGYKSLIFSDLILQGQMSSLGLSVIIVFILVAFMFRSVLLGLVSTIPVLISIAVNFGVMGLLNVPLTTSTALISSIAVGIGVDYAIHLITHYREALKALGDEERAARFAMSHTGRAVLLNAAIVISGFMVMVFSVFPPNRQVGLLVSLNMLTAFLATVTIMFMVLRSIPPRLSKEL